MENDDLFGNHSDKFINAPLADILRPKELIDFYGQSQLLHEDSLLRDAILTDKVGNIILSAEV